MSDTSEALVLGARWRLEETLASGEAGETRRAHEVTADPPSPEEREHVVVKILRARGQARKDRLLREMQRIGRIKHPGLARVHDVGQTQAGDVYVVVEDVQGESLADRLIRLGPMTPREAASMAVPICHALAAAHDLGVAHRDVRPANVVLLRASDHVLGAGAPIEAGDVKIVDLGFFRLAGVSKPVTPEDARYVAPEHERNEPIGRRADVYAMGALLQTMVARDASADTAVDLLGPLAPIVRRCTEDDPRARYLDAAELEAALIATIPAPEAHRIVSSLPPRMPSVRPPRDAVSSTPNIEVGEAELSTQELEDLGADGKSVSKEKTSSPAPAPVLAPLATSPEPSSPETRGAFDLRRGPALPVALALLLAFVVTRSFVSGFVPWLIAGVAGAATFAAHRARRNSK